jgi:hypothetical protein
VRLRWRDLVRKGTATGNPGKFEARISLILRPVPLSNPFTAETITVEEPGIADEASDREISRKAVEGVAKTITSALAARCKSMVIAIDFRNRNTGKILIIVSFAI